MSIRIRLDVRRRCSEEFLIMRILQVIPRYAPAWVFGGGVRMSFELAREWVRLGHEVTAYTSDQQDERSRCPAAEETIQGIHVRRFRNVSNYLAARHAFLFFYPVGLAGALRSIAGRFDVMHVSESRGPHNRMAALCAAPQGIPLAWSAYGGLAAGEGLRKTYRRLYDRVFRTREIVGKASGLIAQTSHEVQIYRQFGADGARIRTIPLCVNWSDVASLPAPGRFRSTIGLSDREKMILFLGRIHWTKGLQLLIPAFARAASRFREARLVIAGWDHGFLSEARRMAVRHSLQDRILFVGPVTREDRFSAYLDADIFALTPPVYEETSLAALEACACGTACVITKQCEIPGLEEAGAGRMVDDDIDRIADALIDSLEGDRARMRGRNARRMVQERFTVGQVARMHLDYFHELCVEAP
jgi:glycosyltransferase involved in cell wall biosynthesis